VRIIFVGDVMLDRHPGEVVAAGGDPFKKTAAVLEGADIVVANLECVVATGGQRVEKHFTFRADPRCLPLLAKHVDAVSLANNHTCDFGKPALVEMLGRIDGAGLHSFGAGRDEAAAHAPLVLRRKGLRIALLAYNGIDSREAEAGPGTPGLAWLEERRAVEDIRAARANADVVIAFLHWGIQFEPKPTEEQRKLARALIDAGAGAVVGSHPHVTQGAETYKGCPIIYSLGDFIFDFEDPAKPVPESLTNWILRLTVDKGGVVAWDTVVARTDSAGLPETAADAGRRPVPPLLHYFSSTTIMAVRRIAACPSITRGEGNWNSCPFAQACIPPTAGSARRMHHGSFRFGRAS
jgi:poly-gamma-glutamate synthesis protein (capsule biosynthesis protein)